MSPKTQWVYEDTQVKGIKLRTESDDAQETSISMAWPARCCASLNVASNMQIETHVSVYQTDTAKVAQCFSNDFRQELANQDKDHQRQRHKCGHTIMRCAPMWLQLAARSFDGLSGLMGDVNSSCKQRPSSIGHNSLVWVAAIRVRNASLTAIND